MQAGVASFEDEGGAALDAAALAAGAREHDEEVGHGRVGDEGFGAVEDVIVSVARGGAGDAQGVAARAGFGERPAADFFAAQQGRQVFLFLGGAAEVEHIAAEQEHGRAQGQAEPCARAREFHVADGAGGEVRGRAAVFLGKAHAQEPEFAAFAVLFEGELAGAVPVRGAGREFGVREFFEGVANHFLIVCEREIHAWAAPVCRAARARSGNAARARRPAGRTACDGWFLPGLYGKRGKE